MVAVMAMSLLLMQTSFKIRYLNGGPSETFGCAGAVNQC
jgi:hypothetical protein